MYGDFDEASEETAINPSGQYSIWKIAGEELVKEYSRATGQSYVIIRPTAVYGPLDVSSRVIGTFFKRAMADETLYVNGKDETLDFTYAKDTATGIALASIIINKTFDEQMIRHMILNSLRMYHKRYKDEFGEMVLAVDAANNWRRKAFPQYKANRKKDRGTSSFDWNEAFRILNLNIYDN